MIDQSLKDEIRITVIATGFNNNSELSTNDLISELSVSSTPEINELPSQPEGKVPYMDKTVAQSTPYTPITTKFYKEPELEPEPDPDPLSSQYQTSQYQVLEPESEPISNKMNIESNRSVSDSFGLTGTPIDSVNYQVDQGEVNLADVSNPVVVNDSGIKQDDQDYFSSTKNSQVEPDQPVDSSGVDNSSDTAADIPAFLRNFN